MRRTILLADGSPTIQRLVAQTFADADFNIVAVNNGELALRRLGEDHPDILLADVYLPGWSGYEVCAYIRAHPALAATPVILLVGAFDAFDEETALQAGASASITKPFEAQALVDLVLSLLEKGREHLDSREDAATLAITPPMLAAATPIAPDSAPGATHSEPPHPEESDLLGLEALFTESPQRPAVELSDADIERIADRVLEKLSAQAVESVAWDVVPDIVDKVLRETPKRTR